MALFAGITPEIVGNFVGFGVLFSLSLAGILKCVKIARRPTTHTLCVLALLLVLVGFAGSSVSVILAQMHVLPIDGWLAITSVILILYVASFVIAMIGLLDFRKNREAYSQGSAQAKWALGLSASLLIAFCTTLYINVKSLLAERIATTGPASPVQEHKRGSDPTSPVNVAKTIADMIAESKGKRVLDSYNMAFYLPSDHWVELEVDPKWDAKLVMKREQPDIMFGIIPERLGVENCPKMESVVDTIETRIKSSSNVSVTFNKRDETYNGMDGLVLQADGNIGDQALHESRWIVIRNGFVYQLRVSGSRSAATEIDAALEQMCQRFRQIEPELVAHSAGYDVPAEFESAAFGYRVAPLDNGWSSLPKTSIDSSGTEFGAEYGRDALFAVLPVMLARRQTDFDALASSILKQIHVAYPGPDIISSKRIEEGKRPGMAIEAWGDVAGTRRRSLLRLFVGERSAILIWSMLLNDDERARSAVEAAICRVQLFPVNEAKEANSTTGHRINSAIVNNDLGIIAYRNVDYATASELFAFALKLAPDDEQILANHVDTLIRLNRSQEALAVVTEQAAKWPQNAPLRALQAKLLAEHGDTVKARQIFVDLFSNGYSNENYFLLYANLAAESGAYDEAIGVADAVVQRQPTIQVRRNRAVLYSRKGQHDKAIELLEELHKKSPTDIGVSTDLAATYEIKGDYSAALAISQKLIDSGQRDEVTLVFHGRNQLQLHWYAPAKKTFEDALAQYPNSRVVKDYLSQASNLLGEGDNSLVKTPVDAVEIPQTVRTKIQEAKKAGMSGSDKYDATETLNVTGIDYQRGKPMRTTVWRELKIFTTGGVTRYSSMTLRFNPAYERVFVNRLAVFDASGKQVAEGSVNNYYVLDDSSSGEAKQHKVLNTPVPGLKPGYTLRFVVTTEELVPAGSFHFQDFVMSSAVPVGVEAVFVHGDVARITSSSTPLVKVERTNDLIYCVQANPKQYFMESNQPLIEYHLPIVWMGESGGNWEEIGRSYLKDIKEKLVSSEETRQVAAELTKDCHTQHEKLVALASHVQNAFTYQAIEFGRRAMIPNPPSQTLHFKYGDCKDHAVLLRELLECAKIPAYLALVKVGGHLRSEMPSLDQFNHMVVYVPKLEGAAAGAPEDLILDCTDKFTYPLLVPPIGLADKELLVLDPAKPRIVRTGKFPDDAACLMSQRTIRVTPDANGGAVRTEVDERVTLNQFLAPGLRSYLRMYEPANRTAAVQAYFDDDSRLHVDHVTVENLDDFDKPLVVDLKYSVPEAFHEVASAAQGKTLVGHLPSPWEKTYFQPGYVQQRKSPFEFTMPVRVESTVEFELPKGFELKDADKMVYSDRTPFLAWASRSKLEGNAVKLEYRARRFAGRHKADEYPTYYEDAKKALGLFDRPLMIQAIGAKPAN